MTCHHPPSRPPSPQKTSAPVTFSYRRVKAQVANVAGDNLFLLEGLRDAERVVDHRLLDGVHLRRHTGEGGGGGGSFRATFNDSQRP